MPKRWLPTPGVADELGSAERPWSKLYVTAIFGPDGNPVAFIPINASAIQDGLLDPARIDRLNTDVIVGQPDGPTLGAIAAAAATGAGDPVTRINAGDSLISGTKIEAGTLDPEALDTAKKLVHALLIGGAGSLGSDDFDNIEGNEAGFRISKTEVAINLATAVFRGVLKGTISMGRFNMDGTGRAVWNDTAFPATGMIVENDGRAFWGSDAYPDAPAQFDKEGNFYLSDTPVSLSKIGLGAIDAFVDLVQPSQAGGQFYGNLTLIPLTRGATIYYTTNGSDPSDMTNANRTKYTAPFLVDTSSGNKTIKAIAVKFGTYGEAVQTWIFTNAAGTVAAPIFDPIPAYYARPGAVLDVTLSSGTPGATIIYTLDGTTPTDANGTIYTGPIHLTRGTKTIKAFAKKAGLVSSGVVSGTFTVKKGAGGGGGGGQGGD